MSDDDPLADADIGETVRDERTIEEPVWVRSEIDPWCGWDRDVDTVTVEGAEIIGAPGDETIRVYVSAALTKEDAPVDDGDDVDPAAIERPPLWPYFRFPAGATAIIAAIGFVFPGDVASLLPVWLVVMTAWSGWSIVSGLYPWSIGGLGR